MVASATAFAGAPDESMNHRIDYAKHLYKPVTEREAFAPAKLNRLDAIDRMMGCNTWAASLAANQAPEVKPSINYGPVRSFGDLIAPDGSTWFYTLDLFEDSKVISEYYTEYYLREFTINLYDSKGKSVGTVHDKLRTVGLETGRAPYSDLLPIVTQHFFNQDDKYEIVFGAAVNTTIPGEVFFHSYIYSIDGEKDADGNDVPVMMMDAFVADVLDATVPGGPENIYMTTVTEHFGGVTWEDQDTPEFWEKYCSSKMTVHTYAPADKNGKLVEILTYDIPLQQLPGDQESGGYALSLSNDGKPYMVVSKYEDTLTEPFSNIMADMYQRESNNLVVDVYELSANGSTLVQETKIPFSKVDDDGVQFTFCGIGFMRWAQDINFKDFNTGNQAALFVTKSNYLFATDGVSGYSYYLYNPDGSLRKTLFEDVDSASALSDLPGQEDQMVFFTYGSNGYDFHFYDLKSLKETSVINYQLVVDDSDPDMLTSNMDRVAEGDTYKYVIEMRLPTEEDDNAFMRFAWFNADGTFDHMEEVNMGANVNYAKSFISSKALHHDAFFKDEHHEYMILIKRGNITGTGSTEELLIGQERHEDNPDGRDLLLLTADDRGVLSSIVPYLGGEDPHLSVTRTSDSNKTFHVDMYALPLADKAGVDQVISDAAGATITFDGANVTAEGEIVIYNLNGVKVAGGNGSVTTAELSAGIYVARCEGNSIKIAVL